MTTWTPVTQQGETWTAVNDETPIGRGFSPRFAARPAFAIATMAGIWAPKTEQSEVWIPA